MCDCLSSTGFKTNREYVQNHLISNPENLDWSDRLEIYHEILGRMFARRSPIVDITIGDHYCLEIQAEVYVLQWTHYSFQMNYCPDLAIEALMNPKVFND